MADNTVLNAGSGGDTIATDDDGTAKHQYVKVEWGADNTFNKVDTASGKPLPVQLRASGGTEITSAVDTASSGTDPGIPALAIRDDALSALTPIEGDFNAIRVDANGALWVIPSGTVTISGAVTNAGTFAVQEDGAALTALQLIDDVVYVDDADWTDSTSKHMLVGGLYQSVVQTITDGDVAPFNITVNGALHTAPQGTVTIQEASALDVSAATVTVTGTVTANLGATDNAVLDAIQAAVEIMDDWDETNRAAVNLIASQVGVTGGSGVVDAATQRVVLATDVALPAGTNAIGKLAANSGVDIGDVDVTSISAGTNLIGDVGISGARTSGGTTIFRSIDLDESEEEVKDTAGQIYWIHAMNLSSGVRYLKVYNATAATVVVGTTTPALTFPLATQGDTNGAGFMFSVPNGVVFGTAITVAATTGVADADTGAPGANEVIVNIGYA